MKMSRDLKFLLVLFGVFVVLMFLFVPRNQVAPDSKSSWATGKNGMKAAYLGLESAGFRVGRQTEPLRRIPKDARVFISIGSPMMLSKNDFTVLRDWVEAGNTLILVDSALESGLPFQFDFQPNLQERPPTLPQTASVSGGKYANGVRRVLVYPQAFIDASFGGKDIVRCGRGAVVAEVPRGHGRVILAADPGMFSNSGIGTEDNFVFLTNLIHEHAGRRDRVLFAEWDQILAGSEKSVGPLLGPTERLVFVELLFVVFVVLIASARRFGSIQPLAGISEQRRGAEFVSAMAGLYARAGAREAAVGAIYTSFRREVALRFGVHPSAGPAEAAKSIEKARHVESAGLAKLLERCEKIVSGGSVNDSESIELTRAIEGFRRELGIARSTDD